MDETTRLRMRRAHAKHEAFCSCGKIVRGNGGKWNHRDMHQRRNDGHHYISSARFYELFPDAPGAPMKPGESFVGYQERMKGNLG